MISIKTHNILDYLFGAVIALCPYFFGFMNVDLARNVFQTVGMGMIVYSLLTNYPYSVTKWISLRTHMVLDVLSGAVLLVSPWFMGYRASLTNLQAGVPVISGLILFGLVAFTGREKSVSELKREKEFPRAA